AADRLGVAEMAVRAQHAAHHAAVLHAARHLLLGAVVVLAEDPDLGHGLLLVVQVDPGEARRKTTPLRISRLDLVNVQNLGGEAGIDPAPTRFWRPPPCR